MSNSFATPWTVAHQAPLAMRFPRQEYWRGCHFLLQGIFLTQGWNPGLLHCRRILYRLSYQGSPLIRREMKNLPDGSGAPSPTQAALNDLPSPRPHSPSPQPPWLALPEEAPPGTPPPISDSSLLHPPLLSLSSSPSSRLPPSPPSGLCSDVTSTVEPLPCPLLSVVVHSLPGAFVTVSQLHHLFTADPTRQEPW